MSEPGSEASPDFRRSSYCAKDACVEVAFTAAETLVRDAKDPAIPHLIFSPTAWSAFVGGVVAGDFTFRA
jgi:hypothetical protein